MTTICAWCGEFQQEKEPMSDKRVSHTICGKCREKVLGETERHLEPIDLSGDLFGQMVAISRRDAERILQEKGDRP